MNNIVVEHFYLRKLFLFILNDLFFLAVQMYNTQKFLISFSVYILCTKSVGCNMVVYRTVLQKVKIRRQTMKRSISYKLKQLRFTKVLCRRHKIL